MIAERLPAPAVSWRADQAANRHGPLRSRQPQNRLSRPCQPFAAFTARAGAVSSSAVAGGFLSS